MSDAIEDFREATEAIIERETHLPSGSLSRVRAARLCGAKVEITRDGISCEWSVPPRKKEAS